MDLFLLPERVQDILDKREALRRQGPHGLFAPKSPSAGADADNMRLLPPLGLREPETESVSSPGCPGGALTGWDPLISKEILSREHAVLGRAMEGGLPQDALDPGLLSPLIDQEKGRGHPGCTPGDLPREQVEVRLRFSAEGTSRDPGRQEGEVQRGRRGRGRRKVVEGHS